MTLKDYAPELAEFWTDQARGRLPDLAWAINELPMLATLDDVCIELESIAGLRAFQTRQMILTGMQSDLRSMIAPDQNQVVKSELLLGILGEGSTRLCIWLQLQCLRDPRVEIVREEYVDILDRVEQWCSGKMTTGQLERYERSMESLSGTRDDPRANLVFWLMGEAEETRNPQHRRALYLASEIVYMLQRVQRDYFADDEENGIYDVMLEAIPRFPVFDPPL